MRTIVIIAIVILFSRCDDHDTQAIPLASISKMQDINPRDTCLWILNKYAQEDTFLYERFFDKREYLDGRISFVKTGTFIYPDKKSGVIIYAFSDSLIAVELYSFDSNKWTLLDKKTDLQTNGVMFYTNFQDYNFDRIGDIYVNICVSNGLGLSTGQLLTVTKEGHLVAHSEALEIRDMEPDIKNKVVRAHSPLNCDTFKTVCEESYKWVDNKLTKTSKPCKCKD